MGNSNTDLQCLELTLLGKNRRSLARRRESLGNKLDYKTHSEVTVNKLKELITMSGYENFAYNTASL